MEPNRVNKLFMIEPVVNQNSDLIVTGAPFTHHKMTMTLTALAWTETGSMGGLLYCYYSLPFL